jgi:hypothetical protein
VTLRGDTVISEGELLRIVIAMLAADQEDEANDAELARLLDAAGGRGASRDQAAPTEPPAADSDGDPAGDPADVAEG